MVVEAIIHHWLMVVAPTKEGMEVLGMSIWDLLEYLYSYNGLVALTKPERIQKAFDVLTGIFERVVLRTNTHRTVSTACQPCHVSGRISVEVYKMWTTGIGPIFW